jgi:hypothetical protein
MYIFCNTSACITLFCGHVVRFVADRYLRLPAPEQRLRWEFVRTLVRRHDDRPHALVHVGREVLLEGPSTPPVLLRVGAQEDVHVVAQYNSL